MANVLLGATGSVAAVRVPALAAGLAAAGHDVKVVATDAAAYFFDPADVVAAVRGATGVSAHLPGGCDAATPPPVGRAGGAPSPASTGASKVRGSSPPFPPRE
ncbi:MAG TPA: flavoprotein, partial [Urbifossiella sp.]|nr:flavoprotein [Urbifossiella sp.]